jgi:hypothetical protein
MPVMGIAGSAVPRTLHIPSSEGGFWVRKVRRCPCGAVNVGGSGPDGCGCLLAPPYSEGLTESCQSDESEGQGASDESTRETSESRQARTSGAEARASTSAGTGGTDGPKRPRTAGSEPMLVEVFLARLGSRVAVPGGGAGVRVDGSPMRLPGTPSPVAPWDRVYSSGARPSVPRLLGQLLRCSSC